MAAFHAPGGQVKAQAHQRCGSTDVASAGPAQPHCNRHPPKPRPQRIRQVKRRMVRSRRQAWRFMGNVHQPNLQRRRQRDHGAHQPHAQQHAPQRRRSEGEEQQHRHRPHQYQAHRPELHTIKQLATGNVADDAADAKRGEAEGDPLRRDLGHFQHGWRQVAEYAEHPGKANCADGQGHPYLGFGEGAQFLARVAALFVVAVGHELPDQGDGEQGDHADQCKRRAPAQVLAEEGGDGVAEQHGQGQAHHYAGHGAGAFVGGHHAGGDHGGDAEVGAVGQAADKAEGHQRAEGRGEGGGEVAQGVQAHQQQQHVFAQQLGAEDGQQWGADHHAQGVGADGVADLGFAQAQVLGDVGHQAHDGEFAGADREGAHGHGRFHFGGAARGQYLPG